MEALAEATGDNLLDFTPNYDISKQSFVASSPFGSAENLQSSSVRHVVKKALVAQHPPNVMGGGSHALDPTDYNKSHALTDTFTGLIDGFTGELVQGTRDYVLTGEVYEGPFQNGKKHGNGAIVKNVYLPHKTFTSLPKVTKGARFYGTYLEDSPSHGTLVVPSLFTYQGPLLESRPHGENGTLIKPSGYKYEGSFRNGLYHGFGVEVEPGGGMYKGNFSHGVRQGFGEYSIERKELLSPSSSANDDNVSDGVTDDDEKGLKYYYKGQWMSNQKQGEGEEILVQREVYRGQFHANERHGYGSISFESSISLIECAVEDEVSGAKIPSKEQSPDEDIDIRGQIDGECSSQSTEIGNASQPLGHATPIIAEGEFRAGHALCGTNGWTLIYANDDCYIGYATNFKPQGCGVMRFANGDCYTGYWENGKRNGEGCFISGDGKEEYVGEWDEDKIVPFNEGGRIERIAKLTDMAIALLHSDEDDCQIFDDYGGDELDNNAPYKCQRELLESIVQNSLSKSIARMNQCRDNDENWSLTTPSKKRENGKYIAPKVTPQKTKSSTKRKSKSSRVETNDPTTLVDSVSRLFLDEESECGKAPPDPIESVKTELKTYKNGDSYLGAHCQAGLREGYGVYVSNATGSTYSGYFENNVKQGHGILIHPLGKYVGMFVKDAKEGEGTLIFNDASSYNGGFKNNRFNGKGTFCTKDNTIYVGDWYHGRKNGQGCETLSDGRVYTGGFQDGFRSGTGTLYEKAGGAIVYQGSWLNGLFHGEGLCIERQHQDSNIKYDGEFYNGLRHGFGILANGHSGVICSGYWHCDEPMNGKWRISMPDGCIYSGDVKVNEKEDLGSIDRKDTWTNFPGSDIPPMPLNFEISTPQPNGFGAMRYSDGEIYIGNFKDGVRKGLGSLFVNGEQVEGIWDGDQLIDEAGDNSCSG